MNLAAVRRLFTWQKIAALPRSLPARVRRAAVLSGYVFFYFFCLLLFAYFTFPYDMLKERIIAEFEKQRTQVGSPQRLEIGSLGPYWFSGLAAQDIKLVLAPASGSDGDRRAASLVVDNAHVRLSLLPLLIGRVTYSFGAKAFGGEIDGVYRSSGDERIEVELEDVDVGQMSPLADVVGGLPLEGRLAGTADLALPLPKASGTLDWKIEKLAAGDGKAKIQGKIALPKLSVGDLKLTAEAKEGVLKVTKLTAGGTGQDLDLEGTGKIALRDPFPESLSDLNLRFRFSDGYKGRNEVTKSLFGPPGSNIPALFELADPRIKASRRADGYYGWHMAGPLRDPKFEPSAVGGFGTAAGATTR
jgi:type II secretion system protein N